MRGAGASDQARLALRQLAELAAAYDDLVADMALDRRRLPSWRAAWRDGWSDIDLLAIRDTAPAAWLRGVPGAMFGPSAACCPAGVVTAASRQGTRLSLSSSVGARR